MCKKQKEYNLSKKIEIDYRKSHIGKNKVSFYESNIYDKSSYDTAIWKIEKNYLIKFIEKYLRGVEINYLDFACGTGRIISFLETKVNRSFGIDVSKDMLELAKNKVTNSEFIQGDISKEPSLIKGKYNLITSFRFFLNAQDTLRHKILDVLYKKLSKDGIFILNIHGNKFSLRFFSVFLRKYIFRQTVNQLSFWEMKNILTEHNFKIIDFCGIGFITTKLYRLVPDRLFNIVDSILRKIGFLNYFAVNLILVCKKL